MTPRTDAVAEHSREMDEMIVPADFARQLERQLEVAKSALLAVVQDGTSSWETMQAVHAALREL